MCKNNTDYTKANAKESEQYQCFVLLLDQIQIQDILKDDNQKILDILQTLISTGKDALIEYLFEFVTKAGWNISFDGQITEQYNALTYAILYGHYDICKRLLNTGWFDINYVETLNNETPIMICARGFKYNKEDVANCENYRIFTLLVCLFCLCLLFWYLELI